MRNLGILPTLIIIEILGSIFLVPFLLTTRLDSQFSVNFNPEGTSSIDAFNYLSPDDSPFGTCQFDYLPQSFGQTHAINFTWIRQDLNWEYIEPENNTWHFDKYDQIIQEANANNLYLVAMFWCTVSWALPPNASGPMDFRKVANIDDWLEFVKVVVDRYKGNKSIIAYEIWNEPNYGFFWNDTTENFLRVFIPATQVIRVEDHNVLICFAGTSNLKDNFHNMNSQEYYDYIFGLNASSTFDLHGQLDFDVVNFHPYSSNERDFTQIVKAMQDVCTKWGFDWQHKKQLWITEFGWASPPGAETLLIEDAIRYSKCLVISMTEGVRKSIIYRWKNYENDYGILWNNNSAKPCYNALLQVGPLLSQSTPLWNYSRSVLAGLENTFHVFGFKKVSMNEYILVFWSDDNHQLSASIQIPNHILTQSQTRIILQGNTDSSSAWQSIDNQQVLKNIKLGYTPTFLVLDTTTPLTTISITVDWDAAGLLTWVIIPMSLLIGITYLAFMQRKKSLR